MKLLETRWVEMLTTTCLQHMESHLLQLKWASLDNILTTGDAKVKPFVLKFLEKILVGSNTFSKILTILVIRSLFVEELSKIKFILFKNKK